jgi:hypothetical protein
MTEKVKPQSFRAQDGRAQNQSGVQHSAHRVRLPGFLIEEEIGLGDIIKRVTYAAGITPCAGCERRTGALNRWVTFSR